MWEMSRLFGSLGYPISRFSFPVSGFSFLVSCFLFLVLRFSRDGRGRIRDNPFFWFCSSFANWEFFFEIKRVLNPNPGFGSPVCQNDCNWTLLSFFGQKSSILVKNDVQMSIWSNFETIPMAVLTPPAELASWQRLESPWGGTSVLKRCFRIGEGGIAADFFP